MLKIGDFSSLTQISVKTLRYYDEVGLLRPIHVDHPSGYRYYSASQLPQLHRILALKDLGFSLEQIGQALRDGITAEELHGMLKLRRAEQEGRVREEQDRLTRLEARIRLINQEGKMTNEVVIKSVGPQWIVSVRQIIPNYPAVGMLYGEIFAACGQQCMGALPVALWHDAEYKEKDVDAEAGFYLKQPIPVHGRVQSRELPAGEMASIIHKGAYNRLNESYDAVLRWVEANGYKIAGPLREIYLHCTEPVRQDDESYVTEIQVPVTKA